MRMKIALAQFALLALLAGCAGTDDQRAAAGGRAHSEGALAPAGMDHMLPVWADPDFIKS